MIESVRKTSASTVKTMLEVFAVTAIVSAVMAFGGHQLSLVERSLISVVLGIWALLTWYLTQLWKAKGFTGINGQPVNIARVDALLRVITVATIAIIWITRTGAEFSWHGKFIGMAVIFPTSFLWATRLEHKREMMDKVILKLVTKYAMKVVAIGLAIGLIYIWLTPGLLSLIPHLPRSLHMVVGVSKPAVIFVIIPVAVGYLIRRKRRELEKLVLTD